eukprot:scaffold2245_cov232-Pinguiococcus_pyrenoidosus.AAC.6
MARASSSAEGADGRRGVHFAPLQLCGIQVTGSEGVQSANRDVAAGAWRAAMGWEKLRGEHEHSGAEMGYVRVELERQARKPWYSLSVALRVCEGLTAALGSESVQVLQHATVDVVVDLLKSARGVNIGRREGVLPLSLHPSSAAEDLGPVFRATWKRFGNATSVAIREGLQALDLVAKLRIRLIMPSSDELERLQLERSKANRAVDDAPMLNGMTNQGATCYMNSLLQCWYHLPAFRKAVYDVDTSSILHASLGSEGETYREHGGEDDSASGQCEQRPSKGEDADLSVVLALQRIFFRLQTWKRNVSTSELTQAFGWQRHQTFEQQDVQELSRVLCDNLEHVMGDEISRLFRGRLETFIECTDVDYVSSK